MFTANAAGLGGGLFVAANQCANASMRNLVFANDDRAIRGAWSWENIRTITHCTAVNRSETHLSHFLHLLVIWYLTRLDGRLRQDTGIYWLRNATSATAPLVCTNCTHLSLAPEVNATEVVKAEFLPARGRQLLGDAKISIVAAEVCNSSSHLTWQEVQVSASLQPVDVYCSSVLQHC